MTLPPPWLSALALQVRTADLLVSRAFEAMDVPVPAPEPPPSQASPSSGQVPAPQPPPPQQQPAAQPSPPSAQPAHLTFPAALVELTRAATRQCSDVPRLLDGACLLCHLLPYPHPCRKSAYQGVLVLLANKYPKVRAPQQHARKHGRVRMAATVCTGVYEGEPRVLLAAGQKVPQALAMTRVRVRIRPARAWPHPPHRCVRLPMRPLLMQTCEPC